MPTEPTGWEKENRGKAVRSFENVRRESPKPSASKARGSEMVRNSKHAMNDGPKPPFVARHIVKAKQFDADWRNEIKRAPKNSQKRAYSDFVRSANRGMGR